jgi:hypothetical protein
LLVPIAVMLCGLLALLGQLDRLENTIGGFWLGLLPALAAGIAAFLALRGWPPDDLVLLERVHRRIVVAFVVVGTACGTAAAVSIVNGSAAPERSETVRVDVTGRCMYEPDRSWDRKNGYSIYVRWEDAVETLDVSEETWERVAYGKASAELRVHRGRLGFLIVDEVVPVPPYASPGRERCETREL